MTEAEKKKLLENFSADTRKKEDEEYDDPWTEDAIREVGLRLIERLERDGKLF